MLIVFFRDKTMTYEYVVPRSIPIALEEAMVDVCRRWWGGLFCGEQPPRMCLLLVVFIDDFAIA